MNAKALVPTAFLVAFALAACGESSDRLEPGDFLHRGARHVPGTGRSCRRGPSPRTSTPPSSRRRSTIRICRSRSAAAGSTRRPRTGSRRRRSWSRSSGKTKTIANGVEALVVRDTVTEGGEPVEVTDDWYAQDSEGNVWYLGEDTAEYEDGKVASRGRLVRGGRGRRRSGDRHARRSSRSAWRIARSTTRARPRTAPRC